MFIDKEGKLFGKVSIIDIIVILAIVVAAFGVYNRFASANSKVETVTQSIEYTMIVKGVRQGTVDALGKGGQVFEATTKEYFGEIVETDYAGAVDYEEMQNGEIKNVELPEKYDVTVTVRIDGKVNDSGYYTGSNAVLNVGSRHIFYSKYAKTTGEIMSVKEVQ